MQVSIEEFSREPEKYIDMVQEHEIEIAKNGERVALLISPATPKQKAVKELLKLKGILPSDVNLERIKEERLMKKYGTFE